MHGLFIKLLGKPARPPLQCQRASPPRYPLPPAAAARHAGQLASQHRGTAVAAAVNRTGHEGCHRSHPQFGRHSAQQAVYQKRKTLAPNVRAWQTISLGPTYCCHDLPSSSKATNLTSGTCIWANLTSGTCFWANLTSGTCVWANLTSGTCIWANLTSGTCVWANLTSGTCVWANLTSGTCVWAK